LCQCAARRERAFTLVELLVVIAIILLLFGLLLPTFQGIDRLAKNTHCQKNLREIGKAFEAYARMNDGWYPYPVNNWWGYMFTATRDAGSPDRWVSLTQVMQLKQVGAGPEIFFCPFDPNYGDWEAWPANSWETPYVASYDTGRVRVYTGYTLITYRGFGGGGEHFSDGRFPTGNDGCGDDIPLAADMLQCRANMLIMNGWHHGGGLPDGLFNADGNTLMKGGYVVHTAAGEWDWNKPAIVMGSSSRDQFWFALKR